MRISDWSSDLCSSDLGDHRGDLRMGERELQRGGGERHAMGIAQRLDRGDPPDDLGRGGLIFVMERSRPLHSMCQDAAVVGAADEEPDPACRAQRQEAVEGSEEHTSGLQSLMSISNAVFRMETKRRQRSETTTRTT